MFRYPSSMIWFWVVMSIVYFQYRRMSALEVRLFGQSRRSAIVRTVFSLGEGILGGTLGSFLIILLGASAERLGLGIVWLAALALATIDIRFICFSYAGGIVSLLNLALGWPDVDVISIMAFVGVLHLVESALILLSGHHDATPTLVTGPDNRPAGGFYMGKYWPVPITVLWIIYTLSSVGAAEGGIAMPDWWPLLKALRLLQRTCVPITGCCLLQSQWGMAMRLTLGCQDRRRDSPPGFQPFSASYSWA